LLRRLIHATRIAPATKALLTPCFQATQKEPKLIGIGLHSELRRALRDLPLLLEDLAHRPTHISEIVPHPPAAAGCCDASLDGAGGVWFSPHFAPIVWRVKWPESVKIWFRLKIINNSDLEMVAVVLQQMCLEMAMDVQRMHSMIFSDNTPATSWSSKLVAKSKSPIASWLICALAMRQRAAKCAFPLVEHWPGIKNVLANVASRSFDMFHDGPHKGVPSATNLVFLNLFALSFPLPSQQQSWHIVEIVPAALSLVISTLLGEPSTMLQWTQLPVSSRGATGNPTLPPTATQTHFSATVPTHSKSRSFWPLLPEPVQACLDAGDKLQSDRSYRPYATLHKPSSWLATQTPVVPPALMT
jgi:hypothetical protein